MIQDLLYEYFRADRGASAAKQLRGSLLRRSAALATAIRARAWRRGDRAGDAVVVRPPDALARHTGGGGAMTLSFYLAWRFIRSFLVVLASFWGILFLIDLVEEVRRFSDAKLSLPQLAFLSVLNIPTTLYNILPLPNADTVPFITPESKPNKKPPIAATADIKIT